MYRIIELLQDSILQNNLAAKLINAYYLLPTKDFNSIPVQCSQLQILLNFTFNVIEMLCNKSKPHRVIRLKKQ